MGATPQTDRLADSEEVDRITFRETENDRQVLLRLEKKGFHFVNQDVFRENNGTSLLKYDKEMSVFKDQLSELEISFPPTRSDTSATVSPQSRRSLAAVSPQSRHSLATVSRSGVPMEE
uniref:Uncharacterized protein n=1 Tax=Knipowitschia caucasica TaxID=637954 RepID=A0AAV2JJV4_KNICA